MRWRPHRDAPELPTSLMDKKARINWILDHRVWCHPIHVTQEAWNQLRDGIDGVRDEPPQYDEKYTECVSVLVTYTDPETLCIEDDDSRNTHFRIWIEAGPLFDASADKDAGFREPQEGWNDYNRWLPTHDYRLDCAADTHEEALLRLAALVDLYYDENGNDRLDAPIKCGSFQDKKPDGTYREQDCTPAADGFCERCGHIWTGTHRAFWNGEG